MLIRYWISVGLLAAGFAAGCGPTIHGSGHIVTEERQIEDLSRLSVCCGFEVRLSEGARPSLELSGDDNILRAIETSREGNWIRVEYRDGIAQYRPTRRVRVEVVLTDIRAFEGSGGVLLDAGTIETGSLAVTLSGGADAEFPDLLAGEFDLATSGGCDVRAAGEVDRQVVEVSGGGEYRAKELASKRARLRISGGGKAVVRVSEKLDAVASGGSLVIYYGNPSVDAQTSGGSSILGR